MLQTKEAVEAVAEVTFRYLGTPGDGLEDNSRKTLWRMTYMKDGIEHVRDLRLRQKQVLECLCDSPSPLSIREIAEKIGVNQQILVAFMSNPNPVEDFMRRTVVGTRRYAYSLTLEPQDSFFTKGERGAVANSKEGNGTHSDLYLPENPSIGENQVVYLPDYLGSRRVKALKELFHRSTKSFEKDSLSNVWVWVGQDMGKSKSEGEGAIADTATQKSQGALHPDMILEG